MFGDDDDKGRAIFQRLLQLLRIVEAGPHVARRDPGGDALALEQGDQLVRLVGIFGGMADEDVRHRAIVAGPERCG